MGSCTLPVSVVQGVPACHIQEEPKISPCCNMLCELQLRVESDVGGFAMASLRGVSQAMPCRDPSFLCGEETTGGSPCHSQQGQQGLCELQLSVESEMAWGDLAREPMPPHRASFSVEFVNLCWQPSGHALYNRPITTFYKSKN